MPKEEHIKKTLRITKKLDEMVEEIRLEKGYKSFTSVIEFAIGELHAKVFKDYIMARKFTAAKTPEEKAELALRTKEIKAEREEAKLLDIAFRLGGKVTPDSGGGKRVQYYTYDKSNRYLQDVPLEMMDEEMVENQYFPSKEDVLQRQAKGKVNYDPKSFE